MKSVKYAQYRQYTFNRLSKGVGKGEKKSLKQVRRVNEEEIIEKNTVEVSVLAKDTLLNYTNLISNYL